MEEEKPDYNEDEINDYFNDNDVILEDEEEYDVLNDETFGEVLQDSPDESSELNLKRTWDDYDLHNDETFGEEISYDWEAEHEKMLSVLESKDESTLEESDIDSETVAEKVQHHMSKSEMVNQNGYLNIDRNRSYLEHNDLDGALLKSDIITNDRMTNSKILENDWTSDSRNRMIGRELRERSRSIESSTNENPNRLLSESNRWYGNESNSNHVDDNAEHSSSVFLQNYSLFPSGTNLLQNAGIHIPTVPNMTSSGMYAPENLERKLEALKLQQQQQLQPPQSASSIPSVVHLEKQWINDAASKSVITADCFRAYNSAFFVNKSSSIPNNANNANVTSISSSIAPQSKPPMEAFMNSEAYRNDTSSSLGLPYPKLMNPNIPFSQQRFPPPPPPTPSMMNGECDPQTIYAKLNASNRLPPPPQFEHKPFPVPVMTDSGIILCDDSLFRNAPNFAEMNARTVSSYASNNALSRAKTHPGIDPSVIVSSDSLTRLTDPSMLIDNTNLPRLGINVFQPPPGLTIDPTKFRHFPNTAAMQSRPPPITSCLAMQPIQVLNGIVSAEQQKHLMKFHKEEYLSVVDEYAGMMTEREKYWLAGVQLLQINAMDPFKDDYYFTNYQARRKGNRGKNQTNNNNKKWQNEHTKDYLPLQFENSLGKVQVGSVVAPRKVIDTDVFESSPKHNGKLNDSIHDDLMANTSHRKRRAIMLYIENLYSRIIALESLQSNSVKNKADPVAVKAEFESIVNTLKDEISNLRDDFKIVMSIRKGKRLVWRFLMFCDNPETVWFQIFEILDRIIRGDLEHCMLLSYLPYFRTWLTTTNLAAMNRLSNYIKKNFHFYLRDKFTVSVMANMIEQAELIYFYSKAEDQADWMEFILMLAQNAHQSLENVQKPVVSIKPQTLRSHLLKCEKLENGYVSNLLKIFSNNIRK